MNWEKELELLKDDKDFKYENLKLSFIEIIIRYMKSEELNQSALADRLEMSNVAVNKILSGKDNFSLKRIASLCSKLNIDVDLDLKLDGYINVPIQSTFIKKLENEGCLDGKDFDQTYCYINNLIARSFMNIKENKTEILSDEKIDESFNEPGFAEFQLAG